MYYTHFRLASAPFSITPDPQFVYLTHRHRDGLAHLLYGLGQGGSGGFVVLTGEVGTGKTTLCRVALEHVLKPSSNESALASILTGTIARGICYFVVPAAWAGLDTLLPPVLSAVAFVAGSLMTEPSTAENNEELICDTP